jgi:putative nucleotidyltransferase with HDIG domain
VTNKPVRAIVVTLLSMAAITVLVRLGGTDSIAVHFYYLPIIYAGFSFSIYGAITMSLVAALAATYAPVTFVNGVIISPDDIVPTLLRLAMFFVVGYFASEVSKVMRRRTAEAHTLYDVAKSITSSLRLRQVLDLIATNAMVVMTARACAIRLLDKATGELRPVAMHGLSEEYVNKGAVSRESSPLDQQVLAGESVQVLDVRSDPHFQYPEAAADEGLTSVLTVPLRSKGEALGVIRIYSRGRHRFRRREIDLLNAFAHQAAAAIENAELYEDIRRNYYETIRALTTAIEARDPTTYNHSERVTQVADRLAAHLRMDPEQREILRFGCILHDIGKIGIEEGALDARDASDAEQVFYRMHPLIGRGILQPVGFLQDSLPIVVHHHERWDGHGFPEGLAGEAIPLHARICAIVDAYERLRNPQRPGAPPRSPNAAVEEVLAGAGTRFDPALVAQFRKLMCSDETGVCSDPFDEVPVDIL